MGLIGDIKDVASIVQKADNIELYQRILNIQADALEMQEEIRKLKEENASLKKGKDIEEQIERHQSPYITLQNDEQKVRYCYTCWGKEQLLIQLRQIDIHHRCSQCENNFNV